jgi:hypothetical protein
MKETGSKAGVLRVHRVQCTHVRGRKRVEVIDAQTEDVEVVLVHAVAVRGGDQTIDTPRLITVPPRRHPPHHPVDMVRTIGDEVVHAAAVTVAVGIEGEIFTTGSTHAIGETSETMTSREK